MAQSIKVTDPTSAARAAMSRLVLSSNSGWNDADRADALQAAAIAAALASEKFDRLGLEETASGKKGYMVLSARRGGLDWIMKHSLRKKRESATDFSDAENDRFAGNCRSVEGVERRAVVAAVLTEMDEVVGGDHAAVARALLDHKAPAYQSSHPVRFLASALRRPAQEIRTLINECACYFKARAPYYATK